jgi:acetoin:2,6-dichlorophenolindophenol oxidoreductase subunit beta
MSVDTSQGAPAQTTTTTLLRAMNAALGEEMDRDDTVFVLGQDVEVGTFGLTAGLLDRFGPGRIRNTPISEAAEVGTGVGAAMCGLRPWVELNIATFAYPAWDQLINQVAKNHYLFGAQATLPMVVHLVAYHRSLAAAQHTDRPHPMLMNMPGFKIVSPSTPADAAGLLRTAIRDDDPVVFIDDGSIATKRGQVPAGEHLVPIGKAHVAREGTDVTIVAVFSLAEALAAADLLAEEHGISAEVIDPRTLVPLDEATILGSVAKTGHLVVSDVAHRICSAASEIAAFVAEHGFDLLRGPVQRVTTPMIHVPFAPSLEPSMFPDRTKIVAAARRALRA